MNVKVISRKEQVTKQMNEGAIREQKVLGFPQDRGKLKPYSNIFYWSHLKTDYGSVITEHPHLGFEIVIYVLKGSVEILDNVTGKRAKLAEGDMQVIKTGKGMKHFEKMNSNSEFIQIWLDPDFEKHRRKEPSLCKSLSGSFPVETMEGQRICSFAGSSAPIVLESPDVNIQLMEFTAAAHKLSLTDEKTMSGYLLEGEIDFDGQKAAKGDFFIIEKSSEVQMNVLKDSKVFTVFSPNKPSYPTYADMYL